MSKKLISTPLDNDKRLDDCVRRCINIAQRELIKLEQKCETEALESGDVKKLQTLATICREQQKHRIDIEKLQNGDKDGNHNHLHITEEQLKGLTMGLSGATLIEGLKRKARGDTHDSE